METGSFDWPSFYSLFWNVSGAVCGVAGGGGRRSGAHACACLCVHRCMRAPTRLLPLALHPHTSASTSDWVPVMLCQPCPRLIHAGFACHAHTRMHAHVRPQSRRTRASSARSTSLTPCSLGMGCCRPGGEQTRWAVCQQCANLHVLSTGSSLLASALPQRIRAESQAPHLLVWWSQEGCIQRHSSQSTSIQAIRSHFISCSSRDDPAANQSQFIAISRLGGSPRRAQGRLIDAPHTPGLCRCIRGPAYEAGRRPTRRGGHQWAGMLTQMRTRSTHTPYLSTPFPTPQAMAGRSSCAWGPSTSCATCCRSGWWVLRSLQLPQCSHHVLVAAAYTPLLALLTHARPSAPLTRTPPLTPHHSPPYTSCTTPPPDQLPPTFTTPLILIRPVKCCQTLQESGTLDSAPEVETPAVLQAFIQPYEDLR